MIRRFLLLAVLSVFSSGCSSMRYTSTIETLPDAKSGVGPFYVSEIYPESTAATENIKQHACELVSQFPEMYTGITFGEVWRDNQLQEDVFRQGIQMKAEQLYPQLFKRESESSPICLSYDVECDSGGMLNACLGIPYLNIVLSFIPLPGGRKDYYSVDATTCSNQPRRNASSSVHFMRADSYWCSFLSPLGLIPVPGPSARPRASVSSRKARRNSQDLTLESFVAALVLSINNTEGLVLEGHPIITEKKKAIEEGHVAEKDGAGERDDSNP